MKNFKQIFVIFKSDCQYLNMKNLLKKIDQKFFGEAFIKIYNRSFYSIKKKKNFSQKLSNKY